jgi:hypothetical protein
MAGAVNGESSSSSEHTVGPKTSIICSSLSITFTVVITLRVVLLYFLNSRRRYLGFFIYLGIFINKAASF